MTDQKVCPYCGEEIKSGAIKCKHCHSMLDVSGDSDQAKSAATIHARPATAPPQRGFTPPKINKPLMKRWWVWAAAIVLLFIFIGSLGGGEDDPKITTIEPTVADSAAVVLDDPEPEPIPDPIVYTGSGDDVIKIEKPEDELLLLYIKGNSSSRHFAVLGYDGNNNRTNLYVNTTDPYEGITLDPDGTTSMLEISATGSWTIEARSVRSARVIEAPGKISGVGDEVILVIGTASTASFKGNPSARHFAVRGYNPSPDLLVNTTDIYEGTVLVRKGTYILEIIAVGAWELDLE